MRCDFCFRREVDCNPVYVAGETWYSCEDCYDKVVLGGFTDE